MPGLGDDRPRGAAVQAPVQPVHEHQLEDDVDEVGDDDDDQRRAQVADAAQVALAASAISANGRPSALMRR